jgi:outer membrane biosynthesis protein TonB
MIVNGENVKTCAENLARWAPDLRDQLLTILNSASLSEMDSAIQRSAALADQMLNGIDLNENGTVEPISNECGVLAAYEATYRMADMPLLPVNPLETPTAMAGMGTPSQTATPTLLLISPTATERPVEVTDVPPVQPTDPPPPQPTKKPRPTQKPKPTKKP